MRCSLALCAVVGVRYSHSGAHALEEPAKGHTVDTDTAVHDGDQAVGVLQRDSHLANHIRLCKGTEVRANIALPGNTFETVEVGALSPGNAAQCCEKCLAIARCTHWTVRGEDCRLKDDGGGQDIGAAAWGTGTREPAGGTNTFSGWREYDGDRAPATRQTRRAVNYSRRAAGQLGSNRTCRPLQGHGQHTLGLPMVTSVWERLDDAELDAYLTVDEASGIRRQSCGPLRAADGSVRWISGTAQGSPDYRGSRGYNSFSTGPCCPNGHTCEFVYGL
jgi:hypothetical protein